jgi:hypothetical protein
MYSKFLSRISTLRRQTRRPVFRLIVVLLLIWDSLHILNLYRVQVASRELPAPPRNSKRIYIAAQHWNDAKLLRERWNDALISLVKELGIENVYVAIYESGSKDETKDALRELDVQLDVLKVQRNITMTHGTHADEMSKGPAEKDWVKTPAGNVALRRIPFLAKLRNHLLYIFKTLSAEGQQFDTILFLNDVVFTVCVHRGAPV